MNDHESLEKDLAFIILIGGASSRFGTDKGSFEHNGKPLISYQIDALSQIDEDLFLIAKSETQIQDYLGKVPDLTKDNFILDDSHFKSQIDTHAPMLGFYSAFKKLNSLYYKRAFVFSCDMPMIQPEVVKYLLKQSEGFEACIPIWENGFLEPLFAIYPVKKTMIQAEKCLEKRKYKLLRLFKDSWKINYISIEDEIKPLDPQLLSFVNINTKLDLEKIVK